MLTMNAEVRRASRKWISAGCGWNGGCCSVDASGLSLNIFAGRSSTGESWGRSFALPNSSWLHIPSSSMRIHIPSLASLCPCPLLPVLAAEQEFTPPSWWPSSWTWQPRDAWRCRSCRRAPAASPCILEAAALPNRRPPQFSTKILTRSRARRRLLQTMRTGFGQTSQLSSQSVPT